MLGAVLAAYRSAPSSNRTLHGFAANAPGARPFKGRDVAYALSMPGSETTVVVRHNRHGGALRAITGDLFLRSTRAPRELEIALALSALGVPTPPVVAYAVYPGPAPFARSDVVTEEILDGMDLGEMLLRTEPGTDQRRKAWNATRRLLKRLAAAGVRHHDLNVKNVLLRPAAEDLLGGYILDVDRVEFDCTRRDAYAGNRARLRRSVQKWRDTRGARITDGELSSLAGIYLAADERTTSS
jgi:tRNA A-37 threonylcarbamoyl transferase component Bud32